MGLIGGLIGGIGSAVAGIVGGNATKRAARRNEKLLNEQAERQKAWFEKEYNSSYIDRADARQALEQTRKMLEDRYKRTEGAAAVGGATEEAVARQKAAANEVIGDVTSTIAAQGEAHKDAVSANYEAQQDAALQNQIAINNQKAQATAQAASGLATAAQGLGDAVGGLGLDDKLAGLFKKKKKEGA